MYPVKEKIEQILATLPHDVRLVAVSKYHPAQYIEEAYAAGQRIFGESIVQELRRKVEVLPKDIEWHFIGHLQTNKVKYIAPYVSMIAEEETKSGFTSEECISLLDSGVKERFPNVRICGIMAMSSFTDDDTQIACEFDKAGELFDIIKERYFSTEDYFCERSWGMSGDYKIAIRHRSTLIRIGTLLFGPRIY